MNTRLAILMCLVLSFTAQGAAGAPDPLLVSQGRIDALAERIGQGLVDRTLARIDTHYDFEGPGSWGFEWRRTGRKIERRGDWKLWRGDREKALSLYLDAQATYRLGYLPENFRPEERRSWQAFAAIQHKIGKLVETPFIEETVDFGGNPVTIQLYLPPAGDTPPGFVLYTGGVDGSKESGLDTGQLYASAGYATAAFDLVGTGELVQLVATPNSFDLHQAILDHYQNDPRFDFTRVGVLGGSFGGYYAIQLAQSSVESRMQAVINHCGLASFLFENIPPEFVLRNFILPTPDGDRPRSFMRRIGFNPDDFVFDDLVSVFGAFSLTSRGVIGGASPTLDVPILTVNGGRDTQLAPISDMQAVQDSAADGELWVLGLSGHCAGDYMPVARPDMVRWSVCRMEGTASADCLRE